MDFHSLAAAHPLRSRRPARMTAAAEERHYRAHGGPTSLRPGSLAAAAAALGLLVLLVGLFPA